jgi:hypothetical protein
MRASAWIAAGMVALCVYLHLVPEEDSVWNRCYEDRSDRGSQQAFNRFVMFWTEVFVFVMTLFLACWKEPLCESDVMEALPKGVLSPASARVREKRRKLENWVPFLNFPLAFDALYCIIWFIVTYALVVFGKNFINDTACNHKPNRYVGLLCFVLPLTGILQCLRAYLLLYLLSVHALLPRNAPNPSG